MRTYHDKPIPASSAVPRDRLLPVPADRSATLSPEMAALSLCGGRFSAGSAAPEMARRCRPMPTDARAAAYVSRLHGSRRPWVVDRAGD